MKYVEAGGVRLSAIGLGTWQFGSREWGYGRDYAEDESGLPTGGRLMAFDLPQGPGIRNDAGVEAGDEVSLHYDPMISKLIVHAPDRKLAVTRLRRALADYSALGLPTNLPLLRRVADHPAFAAGETTTGFLEEHSLTAPPPPSRSAPPALRGRPSSTP